MSQKDLDKYDIAPYNDDIVTNNKPHRTLKIESVHSGMTTVSGKNVKPLHKGVTK